MKFHEYDPKQIEAESAELRLDAARKQPRTLTFLFGRIFDGLNVLLGLKYPTIDFAEELSDFSEARLRKLLEKRNESIVAFLERNELPARKKKDQWDLTSDAFHAMLQVAMAYILARSGDAASTKRVLSWLRSGPSAQRFIVLCMLEHMSFYNIGDVSAAWEKALREGLSKTTEDIEIVAEVVEEHSLTNLVPDLAEIARNLPISQANRIISRAIQTTKDVSLQRQLADEYIPKLSCGQAAQWFSEFTRSDEEPENDLQNACVQLADHITEVAEVEELAEFVSHFRGRDFLKYANRRHADAVRRITELPNPENEPNLALRIGRAKSVLAELIPERDIRLILESSYFDKVCRQLQGDVQAAEVEQVLLAAETALENDGWGPAACSVLWHDCGESGRKFVAKSIDRFPLVVIQNLVWLIEEHSVMSLAEAFVKASLTDRNAKSLASSHKRKYGHTSGPDVFWQLLDVCKRFTSYDMEDGQVPPDYASLIRDLCKGSAGILKCTSIKVPDDPDAQDWNISFRCFGEKIDYTVPNSGDWFAVGETETLLTKLARKAGFKDSYIFLGGEDYGQCAMIAFAPPAKLKKLAKLAAIPIEKDHPDDLEELRLEWIERLKKKLGKAV